MKEHRIGDKFFYFLSFVAVVMISLNLATLGSGIDWDFANLSAYIFLAISVIYFALILLVSKEDITIYHDLLSTSTQDDKLFIQKEVVVAEK